MFSSNKCTNYTSENPIFIQLIPWSITHKVSYSLHCQCFICSWNIYIFKIFQFSKSNFDQMSCCHLQFRTSTKITTSLHSMKSLSVHSNAACITYFIIATYIMSFFSSFWKNTIKTLPNTEHMKFRPKTNFCQKMIQVIILMG